MAIGIQNYPGINTSDANYPNGQSKDNPGDNSGTPVKTLTLSDYQQFFAKMMREAGLTPNNRYDSDYNGYQYFEAFRESSSKWKHYTAYLTQTSTNDPVVTVISDEIGSPVWTRSGTGTYYGLPPIEIIGPESYVQICSFCKGGGTATGFAIISLEIVGSDRNIVIRTYNTSFTLADGVLNETPIECRINK